jgi:hypothetical protein
MLVYNGFFQHCRKSQNAIYRQILVFRKGFLPVVTIFIDSADPIFIALILNPSVILQQNGSSEAWHKDLYDMSPLYMKWLGYQRVISLKIQVGKTNQKNKWANTDPQIYRRWDQVPRRSKHHLLIDHTCRESSSMTLNAELSAVKISVLSTV